jgi:hypothetical protein
MDVLRFAALRATYAGIKSDGESRALGFASDVRRPTSDQWI